MGSPMTQRLCAAGHRVNVWNRTPGKTDSLAALGAAVHTQAASAVEDADIVISMLESGLVVEDVLFKQGVAETMKSGTLFIDMASIKPREARDHAARMEALGIAHLMRLFLAAWWVPKKANWSSWWAEKQQILSVRSPCLRTLVAPRMLARTAAASLQNWPTK